MKLIFPMATGTLMLTVLAASSWAQEWSGSATLQAMLPVNEFQENTSDVSGGFGLQGGYRFSNTPLYLGAEFNVAIMGVDSRTVPLSDNVNVNVDVDTTHVMGQFLAVSRLIAPSGTFRPYVELMGGGNFFNSTTVVSDRSDGDPIATDDETHSASAWTYGAGVGALYRVFSNDAPNRSSEEMELSEGYVLFSVRYFSGAEAEYMSSGSVVVDGNDNSVTYNKKTSPIEQWAVSIGFQGRF